MVHFMPMAIRLMDAGDTPTTTTVTVSSLLTDVGSVFAKAIEWVGDTADVIADEPILLLACVAIPLVGLGVGMFKRLLAARA